MGALLVLASIWVACRGEVDRPPAPAVEPGPHRPVVVPASKAAEPAEVPDPPPPGPVTKGAVCGQRTPAACYSAGVELRRRGQAAQAAELFDAACADGELRACTRLAAMLRDGEGGTADEARARALLEGACRQGSAAACDALGH